MIFLIFQDDKHQIEKKQKDAVGYNPSEFDVQQQRDLLYRHIMNVEEVSRPDRFITGGPLYKLLIYYQANPLEIFLGKGLTYSFNDNLITASPLADYLYLTSDFYILTFFDQYGAFGSLLLTYIFFIYPLIKLSIEISYLNFIQIKL